MFAIYLRDVIAFRNMINPNIPRNGFLFGDSKGPWKTERLTEVLGKETQLHLGVRLTNRDFRQIAVAIDRRHIRPGEVDDDEDDDDDDDNGDDNPHDQMTSHSSHVANNWYGILTNTTKGITPESIDLFRRISDRWHRWLGLLSRLPRSHESEEDNLEAFQSMSIERKVEETIMKVFGPSFEWRSDEQKEATFKIAKGISSLFVVLPTGGGKTMSALIPTMLDDAKTTVFVTPLRALANDVLKTCTDFNIDAIMYRQHQPRYAKVIIVVTETVRKQEFIELLRDLHLNNHLDRIIIDEAHMLMKDKSYRGRIDEIKNIEFPIQFVYLTATSPPCYDKDFESLTVIFST